MIGQLCAERDRPQRICGGGTRDMHWYHIVCIYTTQAASEVDLMRPLLGLH